MACFFSRFRVWQTSRKDLWGVRKVFWQIRWKGKDNFCNTWVAVENTSFWRKRLKFRWKKNFWPIFFRIIELDRRQGTRYKGTEGSLTDFVQFIRSFPEDRRGRHNQTFPNWRLSSRWKIDFGLLFPRFTECGRHQVLLLAPWGILASTLQVTRSILQHPRGCSKHEDLKKMVDLPVNKRL